MRARKGVDLGGCEVGRIWEVFREKEPEIRIYYIKKIYFQLMKKGRKVGWFKKESQGCHQKKEQSYKTKNSKIT